MITTLQDFVALISSTTMPLLFANTDLSVGLDAFIDYFNDAQIAENVLEFEGPPHIEKASANSVRTDVSKGKNTCIISSVCTGCNAGRS